MFKLMNKNKLAFMMKLACKVILIQALLTLFIKKGISNSIVLSLGFVV